MGMDILHRVHIINWSFGVPRSLLTANCGGPCRPRCLRPSRVGQHKDPDMKPDVHQAKGQDGPDSLGSDPSQQASPPNGPKGRPWTAIPDDFASVFNIFIRQFSVLVEMSTRTLAIGCLAIACLVVGAQAACSFSPNKVTTGNVDVPGATLLFTLKANGTRIFNCSTGQPVDTGLGTANYTGDGYTGYFYYNASDIPIDVLTSANGTTMYFGAPISEVTFAPSPTGALSWLRSPEVGSSGPGPHVSFITRTNTTGGKLASCPPGETKVLVPYTGIYKFYSC